MFEISVLEKNYKQSDPEGRASFMKAMARRLLEFPQELERNIYIDAIAGRYGIASEELKRMVNSFGASMSRSRWRRPFISSRNGKKCRQKAG